MSYDELFKFLSKVAQEDDVKTYLTDLMSASNEAFGEVREVNRLMNELLTTPQVLVPAEASLNKSAETPGELRSALMAEHETLINAIMRLEDIAKRTINIIIEFREALVSPPGNSLFAQQATAKTAIAALEKAQDAMVALMNLAAQRRAVEVSLNNIREADERQIISVGPEALQGYRTNNSEAQAMITQATQDLQELNKLLRAIKRTS